MILALILNSSTVVSDEIADKALANNSDCIAWNKSIF
jgi:hypothetical protein